MHLFPTSCCSALLRTSLALASIAQQQRGILALATSHSALICLLWSVTLRRCCTLREALSLEVLGRWLHQLIRPLSRRSSRISLEGVLKSLRSTLISLQPLRVLVSKLAKESFNDNFYASALPLLTPRHRRSFFVKLHFHRTSRTCATRTSSQ